ncbi:helix-turn-helix domain-containing protein [Parachitinimonas caeni]|uniref:Helix-turn-helix transcriptional regulator n=1 Tax=Parachitinimonas caeni TaxID=3031301 RepID=A0ABT7DWU5_9NEIS|nr:helix-turn-helix transcriptional regulator [Parachitinimonas caeni]MDK2124454.1 helix-turn-helix transcriptional regulator [Parachitinimonas caeni]
MKSKETTVNVLVEGDELQGVGEFHERLSSLVARERSATAFAKKCGVSVTGITRLLRGGTPTLSLLLAIANGAGVSVQWLATGSDLAQKEANLDGQPPNEWHGDAPEIALDKQAVWQLCKFIAIMTVTMKLSASEAADFGTRVMQSASRSGLNADEAAEYAIRQVRDGFIWVTTQKEP